MKYLINFHEKTLDYYENLKNFKKYFEELC